eukprot:5785745-Alexandrium_andersonii.AAC.1
MTPNPQDEASHGGDRGGCGSHAIRQYDRYKGCRKHRWEERPGCASFGMVDNHSSARTTPECLDRGNV